ncbi:DNA-binding transcriptional LysR family regulator [Pseudaminobacter salicylatoxidans]|uniref:DNA-binding transcriptional LysR family regulator n=1 Tax=Pseudaminobacter salicylatoxidans TaxID=93369 RepID=A0A316C4U1_PSESE|nr:LysR substrate-binding domain-containing protein [Pseudaminobacter salicylatoxidans]PWJ81019.1 DNA-binding transcriptional LysR family regulator [Pseudaminobacter salicylatoxidans]
MGGFRRQLPSMTALVVFEAAARQASFTRAAAELGITQAAVSRQVQALEASLGFPLFRRLHRTIELTEPGRALAASMSEALGIVAQTVRTITSAKAANELTISATVAFSHFWLLPKVSSFRQADPDIRLKIVTQDSHIDLQRDEVDVAIRYGDGTWPDGKAIMLFGDDVFPVCSPDYLAARGSPDCVADLARHNLIASDSMGPGWIGWEQWLAAFGHGNNPRNITLSCNFYTDALYAAMRGEGIALGWHRLVDDLLQRRQLVRVSVETLRPRSAYYVVLKHGAMKQSVAAFLDWIRGEANAAAPAPLENTLYANESAVSGG